MLEHVPRWLGAALKGARAGQDKLAIVQADLSEGVAVINLASPAFADGARMPVRFTADGEGTSPPLVWGPLPEGTCTLALLVEDADSLAPQPFVHAVIWGLPADAHRLAEGEIVSDGNGGGDGRDIGRNSFFGEGWLPPDPPTGHGVHHYAFQLFALGEGAGNPGTSPGRAKIVKAMRGQVLGVGMLTGTYSRGEPGSAAPGGGILRPV